MVSIFYLLIFLIPYKTEKTVIIIWRFWMTHTQNLKIVYVKFLGKFGRTFGHRLSVRYRTSLKINLWNSGLAIQNHSKLSITEKRQNKTKYLTWNSKRLKFAKKTRMPNTVKSLRYIKCYSSSSPKPLKN